MKKFWTLAALVAMALSLFVPSSASATQVFSMTVVREGYPECANGTQLIRMNFTGGQANTIFFQTFNTSQPELSMPAPMTLPYDAVARGDFATPIEHPFDQVVVNVEFEGSSERLFFFTGTCGVPDGKSVEVGGEEPVEPIVVTPQAPTVLSAICGQPVVLELPTTVGVEYSQHLYPTGVVRVTATPQKGYAFPDNIDGSWEYIPEPCETPGATPTQEPTEPTQPVNPTPTEVAKPTEVAPTATPSSTATAVPGGSTATPGNTGGGSAATTAAPASTGAVQALPSAGSGPGATSGVVTIAVLMIVAAILGIVAKWSRRFA